MPEPEPPNVRDPVPSPAEIRDALAGRVPPGFPVPDPVQVWRAEAELAAGSTGTPAADVFARLIIECEGRP